MNGVDFIEKNILAIKALTIPFEHIVVDGGSTDGTLSILQKYPHIKILHQVRKNGMYGAINQGFSIAQGEYLTYVNCDDRILPHNYEKLYAAIKTKEYDFIYSNGIFYNYESGKKIKFKAPRLFFTYFTRVGLMPFVQPSSIFSKKIFDTEGPFDSEKFKWSGDFDFFRRIILNKNYRIGYLNSYTVYFMQHNNSLTQLNLSNLNEEKSRNGIPLPTIWNIMFYRIIRLFKL